MKNNCNIETNDFDFKSLNENQVIKVPKCSYFNDIKNSLTYYFCQCSIDDFYPICKSCAQTCHAHHNPELKLNGYFDCLCGKFNHKVDLNNENALKQKNNYKNQCIFSSFYDIALNTGFVSTLNLSRLIEHLNKNYEILNNNKILDISNEYILIDYLLEYNLEFITRYCTTCFKICFESNLDSKICFIILSEQGNNYYYNSLINSKNNINNLIASSKNNNTIKYIDVKINEFHKCMCNKHYELSTVNINLDIMGKFDVINSNIHIFNYNILFKIDNLKKKYIDPIKYLIEESYKSYLKFSENLTYNFRNILDNKLFSSLYNRKSIELFYYFIENNDRYFYINDFVFKEVPFDFLLKLISYEKNANINNLDIPDYCISRINFSRLIFEYLIKRSFCKNSNQFKIETILNMNLSQRYIYFHKSNYFSIYNVCKDAKSNLDKVKSINNLSNYFNNDSQKLIANLSLNNKLEFFMPEPIIYEDFSSNLLDLYENIIKYFDSLLTINNSNISTKIKIVNKLYNIIFPVFNKMFKFLIKYNLIADFNSVRYFDLVLETLIIKNDADKNIANTLKNENSLRSSNNESNINTEDSNKYLEDIKYLNQNMLNHKRNSNKNEKLKEFQLIKGKDNIYREELKKAKLTNINNKNKFAEKVIVEYDITKSILYSFVHKNDAICISLLNGNDLNNESIDTNKLLNNMFVFLKQPYSQKLLKVFIILISMFNRTINLKKTLIFDFYVKNICNILICNNQFYINNIENLKYLPLEDIKILYLSKKVDIINHIKFSIFKFDENKTKISLNKCQNNINIFLEKYLNKLAISSSNNINISDIYYYICLKTVELELLNVLYNKYQISYINWLINIKIFIDNLKNFLIKLINDINLPNNNYYLLLDINTLNSNDNTNIMYIQKTIRYTSLLSKLEEFLYIYNKILTLFLSNRLNIENKPNSDDLKLNSDNSNLKNKHKTSIVLDNNAQEYLLNSDEAFVILKFIFIILKKHNENITLFMNINCNCFINIFLYHVPLDLYNFLSSLNFYICQTELNGYIYNNINFIYKCISIILEYNNTNNIDKYFNGCISNIDLLNKKYKQPLYMFIKLEKIIYIIEKQIKKTSVSNSEIISIVEKILKNFDSIKLNDDAMFLINSFLSYNKIDLLESILDVDKVNIFIKKNSIKDDKITIKDFSVRFKHKIIFECCNIITYFLSSYYYFLNELISNDYLFLNVITSNNFIISYEQTKNIVIRSLEDKIEIPFKIESEMTKFYMGLLNSRNYSFNNVDTNNINLFMYSIPNNISNLKNNNINTSINFLSEKDQKSNRGNKLNLNALESIKILKCFKSRYYKCFIFYDYNNQIQDTNIQQKKLLFDKKYKFDNNLNDVILLFEKKVCLFKYYEFCILRQSFIIFNKFLIEIKQIKGSSLYILFELAFYYFKSTYYLYNNINKIVSINLKNFNNTYNYKTDFLNYNKDNIFNKIHSVITYNKIKDYSNIYNCIYNYEQISIKNDMKDYYIDSQNGNILFLDDLSKIIVLLSTNNVKYYEVKIILNKFLKVIKAIFKHNNSYINKNNDIYKNINSYNNISYVSASECKHKINIENKHSRQFKYEKSKQVENNTLLLQNLNNKEFKNINMLNNLYRNIVCNSYDNKLSMIHSLRYSESEIDLDFSIIIFKYLIIKFFDNLSYSNINTFNNLNINKKTFNINDYHAINVKNYEKIKEIHLCKNIDFNNIKMISGNNLNHNLSLINNCNYYEINNLKNFNIKDFKIQNSYILNILNCLFFNASDIFQEVFNDVLDKKSQNIILISLSKHFIFSNILNNVEKNFQLKYNFTKSDFSYELGALSIKFLQNLCESHNNIYQNKLFNTFIDYEVSEIKDMNKTKNYYLKGKQDLDYNNYKYNFSNFYFLPKVENLIYSNNIIDIKRNSKSKYKGLLSKNNIILENKDNQENKLIENDFNLNKNTELRDLYNKVDKNIKSNSIKNNNIIKDNLTAIIKNSKDTLSEIYKYKDNKLVSNPLDLVKLGFGYAQKSVQTEKKEISNMKVQKFSLINYYFQCMRIIINNSNLYQNNIMYTVFNFDITEKKYLNAYYQRLSDLIIEIVQGTPLENFNKLYKKLPENLQIYNEDLNDINYKNELTLSAYSFINLLIEVKELLFNSTNIFESLSLNIKLNVFLTINNIINQELPSDLYLVKCIMNILEPCKIINLLSTYLRGLYVKYHYYVDYNNKYFYEYLDFVEFIDADYINLVNRFKFDNNFYEDKIFSLCCQFFLYIKILGTKYNLLEAKKLIEYKNNKVNNQKNSLISLAKLESNVKSLNINEMKEKTIINNYESFTKNQTYIDRLGNLQQNYIYINEISTLNKNNTVHPLKYKRINKFPMNNYIISIKFFNSITKTCEFIINSTNDIKKNLNLKIIYYIIDPKVHYIDKKSIDNFLNKVDRSSSTKKLKGLLNRLNHFISEIEYRYVYTKKSRFFKWMLDIDYSYVDKLNFFFAISINFILLVFLKNGYKNKNIYYFVCSLSILQTLINIIFLAFFLISKYRFYVILEKSNVLQIKKEQNIANNKDKKKASFNTFLNISFYNKIEIYILNSFILNEEIYIILLNIIVCLIASWTYYTTFLFSLQLLTIIKFVPAVKQIVTAFNMRITQLISMICFLIIILFIYANIGFQFYYDEFKLKLDNVNFNK